MRLMRGKERSQLLGFAAATAVCGALVGLVGCGAGTERSVEAFCSTLKSEKQRIVAQMNAGMPDGSSQSLDDVIRGAGASLQVMGELRTYFHRLSAVAPSEIQPPLEIVRDAYDKQFDQMESAMENPLAALASGVMNGIATSGQLNEVNAYAQTHCGEGI